jgi:hypothetical protein
MKWIPWYEKEPDDDEWILIYQATPYPYVEILPPMIKFISYTRYEGAWEHFKEHPEERRGWTHWTPIAEVPLPKD